ncbi:TPA: DUF1851 domain-containing protein [Streptococcus suis]|nr:DUF1851 domain-containing protein [Streptococcus suis]
MLDNFIKLASMPEAVIERYSGQVPIELLRIWKEYGLGTFVDGYLKVINPDDYLEFVQASYFRGEKSVPIFTTAFGDIIVYTQDGYIDIVYYRNNDFEVAGKKMSHFLNFIKDEDFQNDYFEIQLYEEAIARLGPLSFEQCFGFVPLLALGGKKSISNMDKVNTLEHLSVITQLTGGVGFDD